MVTYWGSKSFSISIPSLLLGRSTTWPLLALMMKSFPRYFWKVRALVGLSTMSNF